MENSLDQGGGCLIPITEDMTEPIDIAQLCRLCANISELTIPIFEEEGLDHDLKSKICRYLPIKVKATDKLPTQLCYQCASTIVAWHDLVDGCIDADKKLRSLIGVDSSNSYAEDMATTGNLITDFMRLKPKIEAVSTDSKEVDDDQDSPEVIQKVILNDSTKSIFNKTYEDIETTVVVHDFVETEDGQLIVYIDNDAVQTYDSIDVNDTENTSIEAMDHEESGQDENDDGYDTINASIETVIKRVCHTPGRKSDLMDPKLFNCEQCSRVFTNKNSLRFHMVAHSNSGNFCKYCNANYKRMDHLQKHIELMHPDSPCALEPKEKKVSRFVKSFLCNTCGKVLCSTVAYNNHMMKHQSDIPYQCDVCPESFPNRGARRKHEVKSHNIIEKENGNPDGYHICEICGMEFFSDGGYYHHKMKHGDPHPCHICGKLYPSRSLMQTHARRHTTERPFKCPMCEKSFKVKPELRAHLNVHRDYRPFQCPHCPRTCRKSSDLTHHIRTHTGEKPFVCDICNRGFAQAGDMRKHHQLHFKPSKVNKAIAADEDG